MCKALKQLIPLFELLKDRFDLSRMKASDDSKVDVSMLNEVDKVLNIPYFLELSEMVRVVGTILERTAHRLEGCECHGGVWLGRMSAKRKRTILKRRTGYDHCFMKGR